MPMLTGTQPQQGDPIALAMVAVLLLIVIVAVLRKRFSRKAPISSAPTAHSTPLAPGSAGQIKLHDVDPKTAAMIMAIVADRMDKPINELRFISIKEVK